MEIPRTLFGLGKPVACNTKKRAVQAAYHVLLYGLFFVASDIVKKLVKGETFYGVGQIEEPILSNVAAYAVSYAWFIVVGYFVIYAKRSHELHVYEKSKLQKEK